MLRFLGLTLLAMALGTYAAGWQPPNPDAIPEGPLGYSIRLGLLILRADTVVVACASVLTRVLGLHGSSSRKIRWISSKPALLNRSFSNGVVPVSNSYSSTPKE